jgi:hypothetical protein
MSAEYCLVGSIMTIAEVAEVKEGGLTFALRFLCFDAVGLARPVVVVGTAAADFFLGLYVRLRLTVALPGAPGADTPAGTTVCGPIATEGAKANTMLVGAAKTSAARCRSISSSLGLMG